MDTVKIEAIRFDVHDRLYPGRWPNPTDSVHWLELVHVECNTQGSKINRPGGKVPKGWLEHHLVRAAPFDTLGVLVENKEMPKEIKYER